MDPLIVDVHTHIYPPSYLALLSSRTDPPLLHHPKATGDNPKPSPRLIILPSDAPSANPHADPSTLGRPLTEDYSSLTHILQFMDQHCIHTSVLSLANPWLDFLAPDLAPSWSRTVNEELESIAFKNPGRVYFFGTLPLSAPISEIVESINFLTSLPHCRGIILGTSGLGSGLDDPALNPVWAALEQRSVMIFIHPHYGLPTDVFGPRRNESGHVMPLSLGFPMETTIAMVRMFLVGIFDEYPGLRVLLAHAGGAVGALGDRVQSCVEHERGYYSRTNAERIKGPKRSLKEVLKKNVWLDAISYGATGLRMAVELVGKERVMWGSDHPFFPPVGGSEDEEEEEWASVRTNVAAVQEAFGKDEQGMRGVLGSNAVELLGLDTQQEQLTPDLRSDLQ
ncbi:MAG: hypothetical protein L6R37_008310 [Teloschistes peruensis]|nr:MAG: hypothetical protein L6R37_008310 [Teloschistes peruensis]